MKKTLTSALCTILTIFVLSFCACTKDATVSYNATNLQAKSADSTYDLFQDVETLHPYTTSGWNDFCLLNSYQEYTDYGLDLDYTAAFFENNKLIVILKTSCSSDGFVFDRVAEKDGSLYPVIKRHYISDGQAVTDDIIFNVFYVEVPTDADYTLGEILYEYY